MTDTRKGKGREFGLVTEGEGEGRGTPARTLMFVRLSHSFIAFFNFTYFLPR